MMRVAFSETPAPSSLGRSWGEVSIRANSFANLCLEKIAIVVSIPRSAWNDEMCLVFKKPLRYAVAGYGVLSCVKGGVIKKTVALKSSILISKTIHNRINKGLTLILRCWIGLQWQLFFML